MARRTAHVSPWGVVAVTVCGLALVAGVSAVGLAWLVAATFFGPSDPARENRAVVTRGMSFDACRQEVSGTLERHYEWDNPKPVDVTVTAYTPDGPADGVRVTVRRAVASSAHLQVELTDEQATAFGHPDARRTVSLRRADGQLLQGETEWK